jgi:hypothetical protein
MICFILVFTPIVALGTMRFDMSGTQQVVPSRTQYYKTWASYKIPMQPVDPITYEQTEPLSSYYLGYFDNRQRLAKFVKYLVERKPAGVQELPRTETPHTVIYFEAIPGEKSSQVNRGKEIPYTNTEQSPVYFKGVVDGTGKFVELEQVTRRVFFSDEYWYWENGKLKERALTKQDGTVVKSEFDKDGRQLR